MNEIETYQRNEITFNYSQQTKGRLNRSEILNVLELNKKRAQTARRGLINDVKVWPSFI